MILPENRVTTFRDHAAFCGNYRAVGVQELAFSDCGDAIGEDYDDASNSSRSFFFSTLPLALRGNGVALSAMVSGTL